MGVYIQGTGSISPQGTHDEEQGFLKEPREFDQPLLRCEEPNYKEFIPPKEARRMSRMVKMGISAASLSLKRAGVDSPDAITTGTGLGCMEETEKFLTSMIDEEEQVLNPSPFIRSTHNSIGGQLAISLACKGYNHTYVHRGLSAPSALLDGMMLLREGRSETVLAGAFDEITDNSYRIFDRLGFWKKESIRNLDLLKSDTSGSIAGEGAHFFLLSGERSEKTLAELKGVDLFYAPDSYEELEDRIKGLLSTHSFTPDGLDAVLYGYTGDPANDKVFDRMREELFPDALPLSYKQLSGEYHTASAFALWAGSKTLQRKEVPEALRIDGESNPVSPRSVLIIDHYFNKDYAFYLLSE